MNTNKDKVIEDYNALKTKVVGMKAVAENNRKALEYNVYKFRDIINNIPESTLTRLRNSGVDLKVLEELDYTRLKADPVYIESTLKQLASIIMSCNSIVEEALK